MQEWNNCFNNKRIVGDKAITIGQQNFIDGTIMIKEQNDNIINCPMYQDKAGNIFFIYNDTGVYISDYLGNFSLIIN